MKSNASFDEKATTVGFVLPVSEVARIKSDAKKRGVSVSTVMRGVYYNNKMQNGGIIEAPLSADIALLQKEVAELKAENERLRGDVKFVVSAGTSTGKELRDFQVLQDAFDSFKYDTQMKNDTYEAKIALLESQKRELQELIDKRPMRDYRPMELLNDLMMFFKNNHASDYMEVIVGTSQTEGDIPEIIREYNKMAAYVNEHNHKMNEAAVRLMERCRMEIESGYLAIKRGNK